MNNGTAGRYSRSRSPPGRGGRVGGGASFDEIQHLVDERQRARRDKAFQAADTLREDLRDMGVTVNDTTLTWDGPDGMSGKVNDGKGLNLHSQSPRGGGGGSTGSASFDQIQYLVDERQRARRDKAFQEADKLREELRDMGVTVNDTDLTWDGPDGMRGRANDGKGGGKGGRRSRSRSPPGRAGRVGGGASFDQIQYLVDERQRARRDKAFQAADKLREDLRNMGVTVNDTDLTWDGPDGMRGRANDGKGDGKGDRKGGRYSRSPSPPGRGGRRGGGPSFDQIQYLVDERQRARRDKAFQAADKLREELRDMGVTVNDTDLTWDGLGGMNGRVNDGKGGGKGGRHSRSRSPPGRGGRRGGGPSFDQIQYLVDERQRARRDKAFQAADKLREDLRDMGVTVNDTDLTWDGPDGMRGRANDGKGDGKGGRHTRSPSPPGRGGRRGGGPSFDQIQYLVDERQRARRDKAFQESDRLRNELRDMGVTVNDTDLTWDGLGMSGKVNNGKGGGDKGGCKGNDRGYDYDNRGRGDRGRDHDDGDRRGGRRGGR